MIRFIIEINNGNNILKFKTDTEMTAFVSDQEIAMAARVIKSLNDLTKMIEEETEIARSVYSDVDDYWKNIIKKN